PATTASPPRTTGSWSPPAFPSGWPARPTSCASPSATSARSSRAPARTEPLTVAHRVGRQGAETALDHLDEAARVVGGGEVLGDAASALAPHAREFGRVADDVGDPVRHGGEVPVGEHIAGLAWHDEVIGAVVRAADDGETRGHRLDRRDRRPL